MKILWPVQFVLVIAVFSICLQQSVSAQGAREKDRDKDRDKKDQPTERQLEARASEAEESLLTEYMEIASEYYKQGQKDKSLEILSRIERINPNAQGLKQKAQIIREEIMQANGLDVEIETNRGWGNPVAEVEEGKPFRIAADGSDKITLTGTVSVTGLSTSDPSKDHAPEAPFGALIGMVMTDGTAGQPFPIGAQAEVVPKKSGVLYLRPNVPTAAKCSGTLKAHLSGNLKSLTPASRRSP